LSPFSTQNLASSIESALDLPPAVQVMSMNAGPSCAILRMRSWRLSTPASVRGGKNCEG
jgi:hypothetical protein